MKEAGIIDVIIIGGGLAGLISANHLSIMGLKVLVVEKNSFPKHKVCGEYISNEVIPYLLSLDFNPYDFGAKRIKKFILSTPKGKGIETVLPLGGFSISRFTLDNELAKKAKANGAKILQDTVIDIKFSHDIFTVETKNNGSFISKIAMGAYGKRSNIDIKLNRSFIKKESPFLAVKAHYKGDFPEDLVALHNFKGGYCGVSKVENDEINICYIVAYKSFKKYKNIDEFQNQVVCKNEYLKTVFENSKISFSKPLTISQISFSAKKPVEEHILMCGDTAGMIHPLCGNGMGMAIHSAQIASTLILRYFGGEIKTRANLESKYSKEWNHEFNRRLKTGRILATLIRMNNFSEFMMLFLKIIPGLLPIIIRKTHGKPLAAI